MLRVFLDANVLFSAAYREKAGLLALWEIPGAHLLTSGYAAEEARRNLDTPERRARLEELLEAVEIVDLEALFPEPDVREARDWEPLRHYDQYVSPKAA